MLPLTPPDGIYTYAETFQGKPAGTTTITVKRDASNITASENASIAAMGHAVSGVVTVTLGAATLAPANYDATYTVTDGPTVHAKVAFNGTTANETNDIVGNKTFDLGTNLKGFSIIDAGFMAGTLFLPAQIALAHGAALDGVVPSFGVSLPLTADVALKPDRPSAVPANDAVVAFSGQQAFSVWYDPTTMVVDEVDVPSQQSTVIRKH
jgi:hypothetical protein